MKCRMKSRQLKKSLKNEKVRFFCRCLLTPRQRERYKQWGSVGKAKEIEGKRGMEDRVCMYGQES